MTKYIKNQLRKVGQTKKVDYSNYTTEELENIVEKNRDPMITEISEEKKPSQFAKARSATTETIKSTPRVITFFLPKIGAAIGAA